MTRRAGGRAVRVDAPPFVVARARPAEYIPRVPHSIFLRPFIDELARTSSRAEDELAEEFRAAAEAAVHRALGRRTPLSVELSPEGPA